MPKALRRGRITAVGAALSMMAVLAGGIVVGPLAPSAGAGPIEETLLLTLTNTARAAAGAPPLTLDPALSSVARAWSDAMAAAGTISHNPNLKTQVSGWSRLAENVGMGPSVEVVQQALLNSPGHYTNMTNPAYTRVGLAVTSTGLEVFITEDFILPAGSPAPPLTTPPATSTPATSPPNTTPRITTPAPTTTLPPAVRRAVPAAVATIAAPPATPTAGDILATRAFRLSPSAWIELVFEQLRVFDPRQRGAT